MIKQLIRIPMRVWLVLGLVVVASIVAIGLRVGGAVSPTSIAYLFMPTVFVAIALGSGYLLAGPKIRVRHADEKMIRVVSVLALWFVVYILSGLIFTYVGNSLTASFGTIVLNLLAYVSVAVAVEYTRYRLMSLASRRLVLGFGVIVAVVLALPFMNLGQLILTSDSSKIIATLFVDIFGSLATSALLTYLAATSGLRSQLVYRLGLLAMVYLLPVIPKHDWYMLGVSAVILPIIVYGVLAKFSGREDSNRDRQSQSLSKTTGLTFLLMMVALVMFMTGVFSYKPMVIMSNSMSPVFSRGAMVIVQKAKPIDIKEGDIVQYEAAGKMVTHRVQEVGADPHSPDELVFITKGDNSPDEDRPVHQSQMIGVVRAALPYIGYPTVWLQETIRGR